MTRVRSWSLGRSWPPSGVVGWTAFAIAAVLLALTAFATSSYALDRPVGADVAAYWEAAERLRSGGELYASGSANATELYRYAPWFAYLWVPLTYLPRDPVTLGWVGLMILAAAASVLPLLRQGSLGFALFALLAPLQLQGAMYGNVQPLLVLALLSGVDRRSGPLWVALGASLKAVPILLAVTYASRGEWRRAGLALGLAAVLIGHAFLFDVSGYSLTAGPNQVSLAGYSFPLWGSVALLSVIVAWLAGPSRHGWLAAAVAMVLSLPRLLSYELGFLLIGLAGRSGSAGRDVGARAP